MKTTFRFLGAVLIVSLLAGCDRGGKPAKTSVELDQAMATIIKPGADSPKSPALFSSTNAIAAK